MANFTEIIQKLLFYDDLAYYQLPKKINEKIIINFKESKNKENKNEKFKIYINDLSNYFKLDKIKIVKLLYFNVDSFHQILYDYDIEIILDEEQKNLPYIFYSSLLIQENLNIINYSFTIELIKGINNKINENKNKTYLILLLSKSIFDFIDAYKGLPEYNNNLEEIKEIENNNTNIIEKLIEEINETNKNNKLKLNFNLAYIKSQKVDKIYIDIIIDLLKNKFEDYNYIYRIITEMELESIDITKTMLEETKNFLDDKSNGIMDEYLISKSEDLHDENKINFSYILLKYILKSSNFIYQIEFFQKIRNNLLKLGKSELNNFFNQQKKDKSKYILEVMFNSEYYNKKYIVKDTDLNDDKSTEISMSDKISNNKTVNVTTNNSLSTSKDSIDKNIFEKENTQNICINSNENNSKSTMKETFNSQKKNNNKGKRLNSSNNNSDPKTKHYFTKKNDDSKTIVKEDNQISQSINSTFNKSIKQIGEHIRSNKDINNIKKKYTAEFIIEINNIFVSFGTNNELNIYNDSYSKTNTFQTEDWIYNALEVQSKNNKTTDFLIISKKKLYTYSNLNKTNEIKTENNMLYLCFMESSYYYSCCENGVFMLSSLLDQLQNKSKFPIYTDVLMKSAIKVNSNLLFFKSNNIASKGISKLKIFQYRQKKDIPDYFESAESDQEYSFVFSPSGQALMTYKSNDSIEDPENKIVLFACKKYIKNQKNGILLIYNLHKISEKKNDNNLEKVKVYSCFYNTDIFEPYCICPLLIVNSKEYLINSVEIKETDYFLVGGFEKIRKQGVIKLYKIIYNEKSLSIEYIEDFKLYDNKFKGFEGPISCITQSKKDENILITCWDGKVYLAGKSNIRFYLKQDEQIKKSANDFFSKKKSKKCFNNNNDIDTDAKTNSNF